MNNSSGATTTTVPAADDGDVDNNDHNVIAIKAGLYSFIFIIGIFGNVLVVKATKQYMTLQGATNILICNLCVCDIVMLVLGMPIFVVSEHRLKTSFGTTACKIFNPLAIATITAIVYTLVAIAVERCNVIVNSRRFKVNLTSRRTYYVIAAIDILAVVSSAPLAVIEYKSNSLHCLRVWNSRNNTVYTVILFLFQYVFPLLVMVILYSMCWYRIRKKNKATIKLATNNRRPTIRARRSQSDGDIISIASGEYEQEQQNDVSPQARPVSGNFLHNEIKDFLSGSQNHLSGIKRRSWQRTTIMRRSFSVDSILENSSESINNKRRRSSQIRKSATYDARLSVSLSGGDDSDNDKDNGVGNLSRRRSFVGSMQRIHASFTSLIIGTDGQDALTAFAMKRRKQTLKTLRMFSFLVLVFAVCFLPHHVNSFIFEDVPDSLRFMEIFIYISAAINPWIYAGMNKSYRVAFASFFQQRRRNGKRNKFRTRRNRERYNRSRSNSSNRRNIFQGSKTFPSGTLEKFVNWFYYKFSNSKGMYDIEPCDYDIRECPDELESLNNVVEERDTLADLDTDQFGSPSRKDSTGRRTNSVSTTTTTRKDSRISRGSTSTTEEGHHHHIPVLAPIIIITNYDEELALQRALEKARESVVGDEDDDEDRFSAIISFNDA